MHAPGTITTPYRADNYPQQVRQCTKEYWDTLIHVNQTLSVCRKQIRWLDTKALLLLKYCEFILSPVSLLMVWPYLKELGTVSPTKSLLGGDKSGCRQLASATWQLHLGEPKLSFLKRGKDFLWILHEEVSLSKSRMIHFHGSHTPYFNPILRIQQCFLKVD